jgi:hypothetical protein
MKILKIYIETPIDEDPDLSWLGEYKNTPGPCAIDRHERGDQGRNEYRYWNPGSNHCPVGDPKNWEHVGQASINKVFRNLPAEWKKRRREFKSVIALLDTFYIEQDYERHEAYENGHWHMVGVRVVVQIEVKGTVQTVQSPGIWGVESDGRDYHREVAEDEYHTLVGILKDMGVKSIPPFSKVEFKD